MSVSSTHARRIARHPPDDLRGASLRLTAQFTVLVLLVLAVVGGIVYAIVGNSISEAENRALIAATRIDSGADAAAGTFVTFVDVHGGGQIVAPPGMPPGLLDTGAIGDVASGGEDQRSQRTIDGHTYLILTTSSTGDRGHDRVVQVAFDRHESTEELARLATALLLGSGVAAALAFLAAYLMARRAIRPLATALALQRRFVADASHELRTPLTLLSTRAQMLKRRSRTGVAPDIASSIDELVVDAGALTDILDDLLIAADPRSDVASTPIDIVAVADRAVALLADHATARRIGLRRTGNGSSVIVWGAEATLLRLIMALTTNALDHARTAVTVSVTGTASTATLTVADDGPGFSPESAATAFDRFASNRSALATPESGQRHYGLGLAIVFDIARRHGGTVSIDPAALGGVVVCTLPLAH